MRDRSRIMHRRPARFHAGRPVCVTDHECPVSHLKASPASVSVDGVAMTPSVQPRILVVDDDQSVRAFVCDMLRSLGYETDDAEGGVQGLALLERLQYDVVIT